MFPYNSLLSRLMSRKETMILYFLLSMGAISWKPYLISHGGKYPKEMRQFHDPYGYSSSLKEVVICTRRI